MFNSDCLLKNFIPNKLFLLAANLYLQVVGFCFAIIRPLLELHIWNLLQIFSNSISEYTSSFLKILPTFWSYWPFSLVNMVLFGSSLMFSDYKLKINNFFLFSAPIFIFLEIFMPNLFFIGWILLKILSKPYSGT